MRPAAVGARRGRSPWTDIRPAGRPERQDGTVAELVRWARFVDPGPDASEPQRAAALQALVELVEEPAILHDAWAASLRMLARGEVTRSLVALLADAISAHEMTVSA